MSKAFKKLSKAFQCLTDPEKKMLGLFLVLGKGVEGVKVGVHKKKKKICVCKVKNAGFCLFETNPFEGF